MRSSTRTISVFLPLSLLFLGVCAKGESGRGDSGATATPEAAPSAASGSGSITAADIRAYKLSMDRVRAIHQASLVWAKDEAAQAEARAQREADDDTSSGDPTAAQAADELMRALEKRPATLAAIRKEGFTARDVAIHTMVLAYSALASAGDTSSPEIAPENVQFIRANSTELRRMQKEAEAAEKSRSGG